MINSTVLPRRANTTRRLESSVGDCINRASSALPAQSASISVTTSQNAALRSIHRETVCVPARNCTSASQPMIPGSKPPRCSAATTHTSSAIVRSEPSTQRPRANATRSR